VSGNKSSARGHQAEDIPSAYRGKALLYWRLSRAYRRGELFAGCKTVGELIHAISELTEMVKQCILRKRLDDLQAAVVRGGRPRRMPNCNKVTTLADWRLRLAVPAEKQAVVRTNTESKSAVG
jgi:hypothetical protein